MQLPVRPFPAVTREDHVATNHREFQDHLRWGLAADTLFLIGSRRAFELQADGLRELAEDCPAHIAKHPEWHHCAEIDIGGPWYRELHRNPPSALHVHYCELHA